MNTLFKIAYKFRFLLSLFIAFFFGFFFLKLNCKASAPMPTVDSSTIQIVQTASELINSMMFTEHYLSPISSDSFNANFNFGSLPYTDLWNWDANDFTLTALSYDQKTELFNTVTDGIYDSSSELSSADSIYLVNYDNGFFSGNAYVNDQGEILYIGSSVGDQLLQIALGGNIYDVDTMIENYDLLSTDIYSNGNYLVSDNIQNFSPSNGTCFYYLGYKASNSDRRLVRIYIPNAYNGNYLIEDKYGYPLNIYSKDTLNTFLTRINRNVDIFNISQNVSHNGVQYLCSATIPNLSSFVGVNTLSVNEYLNNSGLSNGWYIIGYNGFHYNNSFASYDSDDYVSFTRVDKTFFNPTAKYTLEDLQSAVNTISTTVPTINPDYDSNSAINSVNYPQEIVLPNDFSVAESTLPLPNFTPSPAEAPSLDYNVVTQPESSDILSSFSNLQVPFLSNIKNRFPFCIPWDIRDAISLLQFSPTAPAWDFNYTITVLNHNYTYRFVGDLSDFDSLALIFRRLTLCAVFIALAFWSYRIFF